MILLPVTMTLPEGRTNVIAFGHSSLGDKDPLLVHRIEVHTDGKVKIDVTGYPSDEVSGGTDMREVVQQSNSGPKQRMNMDAFMNPVVAEAAPLKSAFVDGTRVVLDEKDGVALGPGFYIVVSATPKKADTEVILNILVQEPKKAGQMP